MPIVIVALFVIFVLFGVYCFIMIRGACMWWSRCRAEKAACASADRAEMQKKVNLGF